MPGLLIIAHAPLATALLAVARHVFPELAGVRALDVHASDAPEAVEQRAQALLAEVRDPHALILTDVFGATPCNVAARLADGAQVRVVAGVNVPMLWRTLSYLEKESLEGVVNRAMAGATQGVMQVAVARPQNQAQRASAHDQDHRHHQQ